MSTCICVLMQSTGETETNSKPDKNLVSSLHQRNQLQHIEVRL